ncbi:MAG: aminoacyl-tRNA hydrolase [Desulfovibrionaceae bacterium]|nr:aminoacyl-tRNA hydrolase [Desulfovibrionaceae bacterium]
MAFKGLVVGLGNPGPEYARNRHNFGFLVAEHLLAWAEARKSPRCERLPDVCEAQIWRLNLAGQGLVLAKPQTFMNLSGRAVACLARRHGLEPGQVLVMHDELDLALGRIKLKLGGGNNGHHGLESVEERLGSGDFFRLRLGIGRPPEDVSVTDWVLTDFEPGQWEQVPDILAAARKGLDLFFRRGQEEATRFLNAFAPAGN